MRLNEILHEAIRRAAELLQNAAERLKELGDPYSEKIFRYAKSSGTRLERINCLTNKSLYGSFKRMWTDAYNDGSVPLQKLPDDYTIEVHSKEDALLLSVSQWVVHRLTWVATEFQLESGPYIQALRQQRKFLDRQSELFSLLNDQVGQSNIPADDCHANELRRKVNYAFGLHRRIIKQLEFATLSYSKDTTIQSEEADNLAKEFARDIQETLLSFLWAMHQLIEDFCSSRLNGKESLKRDGDFKLEYEELSGEFPLQSRVLLVQEKGAPLKWSAVDLDFGIVAFGNTENEALAALSEMVSLEKALTQLARSRRLDKYILRKFQLAEAFPTELWDSSFDIRRLA